MTTPNILTVAPVRETRITRVIEREFAERTRRDGVANSRAYLQARAGLGLGKVRKRDATIRKRVNDAYYALPLWEDNDWD